jgi:7-carboxy-7-deazaguanine synthase
MFGKNKVEQQVINDTLEVNSIFYTIQGEGPYAGCVATFIRLAGCNLRCTFCDTEFEERTTMKLSNVIMEVVAKPAKLVVITGGEPFRQDIVPLCKYLVENGYTVQIETAGTLTLPDFPFDKVHVVVSPKTPKLHDDMKYASSWKYLVHPERMSDVDGLPDFNTQREGLPAGIIARPMNDSPVFIQPIDFQDEINNRRALYATRDIALEYGYKVSIQMHKLLGVE